MSKNSYPQFAPSYPHSTRSYPQFNNSYPHFEHSYPHFNHSYPQKQLSYPQFSSSYPQFFRFVLQNHSTNDIIILFRLFVQSINPALIIHLNYHFPLFRITCGIFPGLFSRQNVIVKPSFSAWHPHYISYMILYIIHYIVMITRYNTIYGAYYDVMYV